MQQELLFRPANKGDIVALSRIYTQPHIRPCMLFDEMTPEVLSRLFDESEFYVLEKNSEIVATCRIILAKDHYAHNAEFASWAVPEEHRGNQYGVLLLNQVIKHLKENQKDILRLEILQETANKATLRSTSRIGCIQKEAIFTSVFKPNNKFIDVQYSVLFLAEVKSSLPSHIESLFHEIPGTHRESHVLRCELNGQENMDKFLKNVNEEYGKNYKKIEVMTYDLAVKEKLEQAGFQCRGQKKAAIKIGEDYVDEWGLELGYFNIDDALELIKLDPSFPLRLDSVLKTLKKEIDSVETQNLIYRMVRNPQETTLPEELPDEIEELCKLLKITRAPSTLTSPARLASKTIPQIK